jgi:hypothetical protein
VRLDPPEGARSIGPNAATRQVTGTAPSRTCGRTPGCSRAGRRPPFVPMPTMDGPKRGSRRPCARSTPWPPRRRRDHGADPEELLQRADIAVYTAKETTPASCCSTPIRTQGRCPHRAGPGRGGTGALAASRARPGPAGRVHPPGRAHRSTIDLGRNLGLRVVAEGVEDSLTCSNSTWSAATPSRATTADHQRHTTTHQRRQRTDAPPETSSTGASRPWSKPAEMPAVSGQRFVPRSARSPTRTPRAGCPGARCPGSSGRRRSAPGARSRGGAPARR